MKVFVSYSRSDAALANTLRESLEKRDIHVWWDGKIEGGEVFTQSIVQAIEGADIFVLLLSGNSVKSEFIARELHVAFERRKRILPIMRGSVEIPQSMVLQLAGIQWLAWPSTKKGLSEMAARMAGMHETEYRPDDHWLPNYVDTLNIAVPRDRLFKIVCDIEGYPRWHSGALATKVLKRYPDGRAARATWTVGVPVVKALQLKYTLDYSYEPNSSCFFVAEPSSAIRELRGAYQLVPTGANDTQVICSLKLGLSVAGGFASNIARLITSRMLAELKAYAEGP